MDIIQHKLDTPNNLQLYLYREFLNNKQADWAFNYFGQKTIWSQDSYKFSGKTVLAPRLTALYGDGDYIYSGITKKSNGWNTPLLRLVKLIEEKTGGKFNSVLLNHYKNGKSSIGMHSDNEPELGNRPVVSSLSLGGSRKFRLQHKTTGEQFSIVLNHGDYLVMGAGTQQDWKHGINKCRNAEPRISLTFRYII